MWANVTRDSKSPPPGFTADRLRGTGVERGSCRIGEGELITAKFLPVEVVSSMITAGGDCEKRGVSTRS